MDSLAIRDLYVQRGGRTVLDGCDAEFPARRRTVLWGRSGVGKSTLLSAIAGLIVPQRGTIALGSQVLFSAMDRIDMPPHKRRIGYVFQDLALWPHLTALEQVRLGRPGGRIRYRECLHALGVPGSRHPDEPATEPVVGRRAAASRDCKGAGGEPEDALAGRAVLISRSGDAKVALRSDSRHFSTSARTHDLCHAQC